jgi:hypothetical protein
MPSTYDKIATYTIPSAATTYTFTSIPGTYTDLVLISNGTASSAADIYLQFNSDTGSNYSRTYLFGDGTSASSGRSSSQTNLAINYFQTTQSNNICQINNYSNSTTYKTAIARGNNSGFTIAYVGLWRSTAAITSITLTASGGFTMSTGSTFTLYGIKAA